MTELKEIFLLAYTERKLYLENDFDASINDAADVIFAYDTYNGAHQTYNNVKYKDAWDLHELYQKFIRNSRLSRKATFENQLEAYINDSKPTKEFLVQFGEYCADHEFFQYMVNWLHQGSEVKEEEPNGQLVWRADPKVDVVDFLKLAYSLHHSGILRASSGKIKDTVNILKKRLDFNLPERWFSNLNEAFEGVNADFNHYQFLDEIRSGLTKYIQSRSDRKEKKSSNKKKS